MVSGVSKLTALERICEVYDYDAMLVFVRTRNDTLEVAEHLERMGFKAAALNGDLNQQQRERIIDQMRNGQMDVVVATDVVARGLDIPRISLVVNYDLPSDSESYVHRIGRTGRAGAEGEAVSLVCGEERSMLKAIERVSNQRIPAGVVPGFEPTPGGERNPPPDDDRPPRGPRPQRGPRPPQSGERQGNRDSGNRDNRGNSSAHPAGNPRPGHGPRTNQPVGHGQGNKRGGGGNSGNR